MEIIKKIGRYALHALEFITLLPILLPLALDAGLFFGWLMVFGGIDKDLGWVRDFLIKMFKCGVSLDFDEMEKTAQDYLDS